MSGGADVRVTEVVRTFTMPGGVPVEVLRGLSLQVAAGESLAVTALRDRARRRCCSLSVRWIGLTAVKSASTVGTWQAWMSVRNARFATARWALCFSRIICCRS